MARRTKEEAEATRHKLLDAALAVFNEKGVSDASLAEVAAAAGLTRGAIYWHFKDKMALFDALIQRTSLPFELAFEAAALEEGGASQSALNRLLDVLRLVLRTIVRDEVSRSVFTMALLKVAYVGEGQALRSWRMEGMQRFTLRLEEALHSAAQEAELELQVTLRTAARGLRAVFDGVLVEWLLHGGAAFDLEHEGMSALMVYLRGLGFTAAK